MPLVLVQGRSPKSGERHDIDEERVHVAFSANHLTSQYIDLASRTVAEFWEDRRVPQSKFTSREVLADRARVAALPKSASDGRWWIKIDGGANDNSGNDGTTWIGTYLPPERS